MVVKNQPLGKEEFCKEETLTCPSKSLQELCPSFGQYHAASSPNVITDLFFPLVCGHLTLKVPFTVALELELFLPALCSIGAAGAAHNPSLLSLPDSMGPTFGVPGEMGGSGTSQCNAKCPAGVEGFLVGHSCSRKGSPGRAAVGRLPWMSLPWAARARQSH